ncbi:MAG: hypothetical protein M1830_007013, partial [Pleopsidium flavum]
MEYSKSHSISSPIQPRLIIHGGAGNITRTNLPPSSYAAYRTALLNINRSTMHLLQTGSTALDAATSAVRLLEDNPLFNCGKGAVFARNGTIELEASVMVSRGKRKRGCGVMLLKHVKNPVLLAREMLLRGEEDGGGGDNGGDGDPSGGSGGAQGHCQLSGEEVEGLGREWGLEIVGERYFWTRRRWEEHRRGLKREEGGCFEDAGERESWELKIGGCEWQGDEDEGVGWDGREYLPQGTVGCVALDKYGTLCVATSTGGLTNKLPGRIGDTPTLGAGFWAEEWEVERPALYRQSEVLSPLQKIVPDALQEVLGQCLPSIVGYRGLPHHEIHKEKSPGHTTRAVAMSGTGNGDSFLRLAG